MTVEYPDGSRAAIYCESYENKGHIMFNHCGGESFFNDMYALAHRTKSIIFWPDERLIYLYTDEAVPQDVPTDFEQKRLVRSGADIVKAIEES